MLDLRDRLLPRPGIEQGKGFRDRGLEKRLAAKLVTVIEAIQLFKLGDAHLPVLIRIRDIEPEPHALQGVIRYRREKSIAVKTNGATIAMAHPTKHWTIEAKKTFAGLTRARRPLSKSAMNPRRHGRLHSSCFNAARQRPTYLSDHRRDRGA